MYPNPHLPRRTITKRVFDFSKHGGHHWIIGQCRLKLKQNETKGCPLFIEPALGEIYTTAAHGESDCVHNRIFCEPDYPQPGLEEQSTAKTHLRALLRR